jgi:phosphatidylserine/phosphatidylglycerophosphate/cardiolipin synthase-like enzyme
MKRYILLFLIFISSCTITGNVVYEDSYEINLYFCPQDKCQDRIIDLIDDSQDIKCAFFELNLPTLITKLEQKNAEVIIEDKNALDQFDTGYSYALMHNKFCIFDNVTIMTGSMNPTVRGNYYNNNNLVIIKSKALAKNYLDEFNELKNNQYGKGEKTKNSYIHLGNTKIENYFCPEDNCKLQVINALKSANESIYFMTFSFTDEDIGNLLWNKNYLNKSVKGILEKRQMGQYSRYEDLKEFSIIDPNPYTMHHKVFVIDEKIVITGSYNPTKNANENNDENILIIHNKDIAKKYLDEYYRLYDFSVSLPKESSDLIITSVMYDAIGSDKNNEYVELKNIGQKNIDLGYYFLSNNSTNFRLNGTLYINQTVKVKPSFSMKNKEGELYLKNHLKIIDYLYWEGKWDIEAKEGQDLIRINNEISSKSWKPLNS